MNIELKGRGTAEPVHDLLTSLLDEGSLHIDDILVTSFEGEMLSSMRELSGETRLGALAYEDVYEALATASELDAYSVNPYHRRIDAVYVYKAHAEGLRVYPWTVNDPGDICRVVGFGVDGVISDYPDRV